MASCPLWLPCPQLWMVEREMKKDVVERESQSCEED
jgi:hypothetical protein